MIKARELTDPTSCLNRGRSDEMTFVLLGRDRAAPWAVRFWAVLRVLLRKNRWRDPQIQGAFADAREMRDVRGEEPRVETHSSIVLTSDRCDPAAIVHPSVVVQLWTVSVGALLEGDGEITFNHTAISLLSPSADDAQQAAWARAYEQYPPSEGWDHHSISVLSVAPDYINRAGKLLVPECLK